eukprot:g11356.t1
MCKEEAQHWQPEAKPVTSRLRKALRIDNFLKGDWASICEALKKEGLDETMDGAKDRGIPQKVGWHLQA